MAVHEKDKVVVDNNGIGYGIFASQSTLEQIGIGEQVKIYTYFSVREDAMQLYGFLSRQELQLFKLLIGVSGVPGLRHLREGVPHLADHRFSQVQLGLHLVKVAGE